MMNDGEYHKAMQGASTFKFGDTEALCSRLLELVIQGRKTATCGALQNDEVGEDALPVVGQKTVALNWVGTPALVLETIDVTLTRFCDVKAPFALAEGENADLAGWRKDHQDYFERNGGFDSKMMLVCERFKLIQNLNSVSS